MAAKDIDKRTKEVLDINKKLKDLGITRMSCPDLQQFLDACNAFIREGSSQQGRTKLTGTKRILKFKLISSPETESTATLIYSEDV